MMARSNLNRREMLTSIAATVVGSQLPVSPTKTSLPYNPLCVSDDALQRFIDDQEYVQPFILKNSWLEFGNTTTSVNGTNNGR